jgi:hypothetical protein
MKIDLLLTSKSWCSVGPTDTTNATTQQRYSAVQYYIVLNITVKYYSDSSPSSAFSISTLQMRGLCPVSPQVPERLPARTLFNDLSPLLGPSTTVAAIKSNTSLTVKVSSARM